MVSKYIIRAVSEIFFPFFFILFFISSIILLITIATITTNIKISLADLGLLFYYGMPGSIFFVIAITFFSACVLGLNRLSYDYETLVFFSLGISPKKIVLIFLPLCIIASVVLLMFSFVMTPLSKSAYKDFLNYKTQTVDVNINPGDFGQKIGDWLLYVDKKEGGKYGGLVLYSNSLGDSKNQASENFIIANTGEAKNENGILTLTLNDGNAYFDSEAIFKKIYFEKMIVRNFFSAPSFKEYSLKEYWISAFKGDKSQERRFSQGLVTSLFPIASIFFIPFFGIRNPRFHKNRVYLNVLGSVAVYFLIMYGTSLELPFIGLALPVVWFIIGFYLYKKYISKVY